MNSRPIAFLAGLLITIPALLAATPSQSNHPSVAAVRYSRLPLAFEANHRQVTAPVHFLAHGSGYQVYLAGPEIAITKNAQPRDAFR